MPQRFSAVLAGDTAPKSGRGSEQDRVSQSPLEIRRGSADPVDVDEMPVTLGFDELNYDKNTRASFRTDPWAESH